jgi:CRP-like cAMP-binding protein
LQICPETIRSKQGDNVNKNYVLEISEILEKDTIIYDIMCQCPYEILRRMVIKEFKAKEFILNQGEIYNNMYIVLDGELGIYVESEHGKKYYLSTYRKGNYIGELEMFGNHPYISSVEALTNVKLLELNRDDFIKWVKVDKNLNDYFIRTLCDSTYKLCSNMGTNTLYSLKSRICKYFIDNINTNGQADGMKIAVNSEMLGEYMAVTQRSVNRILKQLKESGIIEITKVHIVIRNFEKLLEEERQSPRKE